MNQQLASASSQRRASQKRTPEDDITALLNHAFELAAFLLEGGQLLTFVALPDGFPPFGVGISPSGDLQDFNCLPSLDTPGAADVYCLPDQLAFLPAKGKSCARLQEQLAERSATPGDLPAEAPQDQRYEAPPIEAVGQGMKQFAAAGGIHAAALVDRVPCQPAHPGGPSHAIRVQIEHVEAEPVTWYLPYHLQDHQLVRGEPSKGTGRSLVFAE